MYIILETMAGGGGIKGAVNNNVATAMAIAGRDSRACDVCGLHRARWYCSVDNAHLCCRCDQNVHSANALALHHERVRLDLQGNALHTPRKALKGNTSAPQNSLKSAAQMDHAAPSRKSFRQSRRPNTDASPPNSHKINRRGKEKSDSSHEVPNFVTVNIHESPFSFTHDSATAMSIAEYCKGRAAAAAAMAADVDTNEELSSGDSDQYLVPNGYLDDFESATVPTPGCRQQGCDPSDDAASNDALDDGEGKDQYDSGAFDQTNGLEFKRGSDQDRINEKYRLGFSEVVGMRDADDFEGESGYTEGEGEVEDEAYDQSCAYGDPERQRVSPFVKDLKSEYDVLDRLDLIKREVAAVLRCSLEAQEKKSATPPLLRLNFDDVLSAWSDRSLWTDGRRPQTVPDDSSEAVVR